MGMLQSGGSHVGLSMGVADGVSVEVTAAIGVGVPDGLGERAAVGVADGVGLHAGEATVGNIGSEKVMDYTLVGDTVNIAKWLQEQVEGGQILISRAVYEQVPGLTARRLDPMILFGRTEPVEAYLLES